MKLGNKLSNFIKIYRKYNFKAIVYYIIEVVNLIKPASLFRLLYLKSTTLSEIGKNVLIEKNFFISPFCKITIGDNVYIGRNAYFESKLQNENCVGIVIKNNVWISRDIHLQCSDLVSIGNNVLIGEFVSIRGNTHSHETINVPIKSQKMIIGKIIIEDGVWIGRGTLIIGNKEGIIIGEDSIIAANSVVNCSIPPRTVWGGSPAKLIKNRE